MGRENPYRRALQVLQSVAWVEGLPAPFDAGSIQFSPVAAKAWRACVDVVAGLPITDEPMSIQQRLALRFEWTASRIAGDVEGKAVWQWLNPPDAAWVSQGELAELEGAAAMWDLEGTDTADPADETEAAAQQLQHVEINVPSVDAVAAVVRAIQKASSDRKANVNVTEICRKIAAEYHCEHASLRAQYYTWKKRQKKTPE
jgi:hypothetical protein